MLIWSHGVFKHHVKWVPCHRKALSRVAVIEDYGQQLRGSEGTCSAPSSELDGKLTSPCLKLLVLYIRTSYYLTLKTDDNFPTSPTLPVSELYLVWNSVLPVSVVMSFILYLSRGLALKTRKKRKSANNWAALQEQCFSILRVFVIIYFIVYFCA